MGSPSEGIVRCVTCEDLGFNEHRFCECCGAPLPHAHAETAVTTAEDSSADADGPHAPDEEPAPAPRLCECCGGPWDGPGTLCAACERVLGRVLEGTPKPPPQPSPLQTTVGDGLASEDAGSLKPWWEFTPAPVDPTPMSQPPGVTTPAAGPAQTAGWWDAPAAEVQEPAPALSAPVPGPPPLPPEAARPLEVVPPAVLPSPLHQGGSPKAVPFAAAPAPARPPVRPRALAAAKTTRPRASFHLGHATKWVIGCAALVVLIVLGAPAVQRWHGQSNEIAFAGAELPQVVDAVPPELLGTQVPVATVPPPAATSVPAAPLVGTKPATAKAPKKVKPTEVGKLAKPEPAPEPGPVVVQARAFGVPTAAPPPPVATPDETSTPFTGTAFDVTQVDARPVVVSQIAADVPSRLAQRRFQDVVVLRVRVSPAGKPAEVRVLRKSSLDAALDDAAVAAVKQWRFQPAKKRGETVTCWMNIGVPFHGASAEGTR